MRLGVLPEPAARSEAKSLGHAPRHEERREEDMPTQDKVETVAEIKDRFSSSGAVLMADYRGLTVKQMQQLRARLRDIGVEIRVYKNSLTELAVRELAYPPMGALLEGPTAFVFTASDPVAPAKAIMDFAREFRALEIKGGFVENRVVGAEDVKVIAALPSREELIAKLLGVAQNPMIGLVRVLNGPASAFARALNQVAQQKAAAA